jgi:hypothetical protein
MMDQDRVSFKLGVIFGIIAVFTLVFAITFSRVESTIPLLSQPSSPLGYSFSNIQWFLPAVILLLLFLLLRVPLGSTRALVWTLTLLPLTGFILDILFADRFFTFPNHASVSGVKVFGFSFHTLRFDAPIPIEEFVFYITGFLYVLFAYLFTRNIWLSRYTPIVSDPPVGIRYPWFRLALIHLILIGVAFLIKASRQGNDSSAVPEYFLFILFFGITPALLLTPLVYYRVNWQAVSFVLLSVLIISIIWEVTMGIPYGWWGYRREMMMGIFIKPWFNLPLEAVAVWLTVTFTTVTVYEAICLFFEKERGGA